VIETARPLFKPPLENVHVQRVGYEVALVFVSDSHEDASDLEAKLAAQIRAGELTLMIRSKPRWLD
jgi:hypothetical protein